MKLYLDDLEAFKLKNSLAPLHIQDYNNLQFHGLKRNKNYQSMNNVVDSKNSRSTASMRFESSNMDRKRPSGQMLKTSADKKMPSILKAKHNHLD